MDLNEFKREYEIQLSDEQEKKLSNNNTTLSEPQHKTEGYS